MTLTPEQLLSLAKAYWPSSREHYLHPDQSPERVKFQELWERELKKMDQWKAFVRALGGDLPGFTVGNITTPVDACFRCAAYPEAERALSTHREVIVGCVSILAPVYTLYGVRYEYSGTKRVGHELFFEPLPSEVRAAADIIARRVESTFGVSALPRKLAETPVPLFVDPQQPPHTTLFHALFVSQPERVP